MVHTARAVYCQLGDIRKDFVRPSKIDVSDNPSGKLVGELAAKGERATLKIVKVGEFAMRGDVCGRRAALYEGSFLLRMTQDTTVGGMRTPSRLELF